MIKVILVDDHAVVRAGYRMLLQNSEEIEIVAELETGEQACKAYVDFNPDVVVMDLSLPGMGGLIPKPIPRMNTSRPQMRKAQARLLKMSRNRRQPSRAPTSAS